MLKFCSPLLFLLAILFTLYACTTSTIEPDTGNTGYNYFPLETGRFMVYNVQETFYSLTANPVVRNYQVKEVVSESYTDLSNEEAFKLLRYTRPDAAVSWTLDSVWTAKRTINRAIRTENNVDFVKLVFPAKDKQTWNGNAMNTRGEDDYQISVSKQPFTVNNQPYENTLMVLQQMDTISLVSRDQRMEVYAEDIGLIYKESVQLKYCAEVNCIGKGQIVDGKTLYQQLYEYGKE